MRALLNEIIRIGGTTAITSELSWTDARVVHLRRGRRVLFVAINAGGEILGFQSIEPIRRSAGRLRGHCDFRKPVPAEIRRRRCTLRAPRACGSGAVRAFTTINASIRVDNTGGLAYYGKMVLDLSGRRRRSALQGRTFNPRYKRYDI